jgi:radical SAM superfamily enzyme YgiQ (UPF0313 family)
MKETSNKKVLLIVPPFYRLVGGKNNWIHLGLSYIGSLLDRNGFEVKIYNTDHVDDVSDIGLREVFDAYDQHREILNNPSHELWQEIITRIKAYAPDIVGITIVFSATFKAVEIIARMIKEWNSNIKIVVGGPHASLAPEDTMQTKYFDYVVRGEGEYTLLELVAGKELRHIRGLSYRNDRGNIVHNKDRELIENLDALPPPNVNLQLMPIEDPNENFGVIATSRGCPLRCIFCSSPRLWGRRVRFRSVDNVIEEIKQRYYGYGVTKYYFSDDNINLNKKYAKELCRAMINNGLNIEWICEAKVEHFDSELLELMKKAGCKRLKLGVESGSDRILKLMKKGITARKVRESVSLIKQAGIEYTIYVLIGMPTETVEEMRQTLQLARELDANYVSVSVATPHVGTELYEKMIEMGKKLDKESWEDFFHQSVGTVLNENVTPAIIEEFLALNEMEGKKRTI